MRLLGSIGARFSLLVSLLLLVIAATTAIGVLHWNRALIAVRQEQLLQESAAFLFPALEDSLAHWAGRAPGWGRLAEIREGMERSLGAMQRISLIWQDTLGNQAVSGWLTQDLRLGTLQEYLSPDSTFSLEEWAAGQQLPLVRRDTKDGELLLVYRPGEEWSDFPLRPLFVSALVALLLSALCGYLVSRPLLGVMRALGTGFEQLGCGKLEHRLQTQQGGELGELQSGFNQMAERLQQLDARLRQQDEQRRQLLHEVSHEFGAPLTNITGRLELLLAEFRDDDPTQRERRELARVALRETRKLDTLASDLLDLARMDDAVLALRCRSFRLIDLLEDELAAVELACLDRGIELCTELEEGLPELVADPFRVAQILRNLLRNAIQQLAGADVEARLLVRLYGKGEFQCITVEDNGPGIPAKDLEAVFQRFRRGSETMSPHYAGSGLGLPISRGLAELHRGRLWAESILPQRGARFVLELPLSTKCSQAD